MKKTFFFIMSILTLFLSCSYEGSRGRVDIGNPVAFMYSNAMDYYRSGNYEFAIRTFSDIVNYYPDNALADKALIMLARCYEEKGDYLNALTYYELYVAKYPSGRDLDYVKDKLKKLKISSY